MKRKLWHSVLTAKEKKHLKETGCSLVSIEHFKRNLASQKGGDCNECRFIAQKIGLLP
jgi:hypothetical protein